MFISANRTALVCLLCRISARHGWALNHLTSDVSSPTSADSAGVLVPLFPWEAPVVWLIHTHFSPPFSWGSSTHLHDGVHLVIKFKYSFWKLFHQSFNSFNALFCEVFFIVSQIISGVVSGGGGEWFSWIFPLRKFWYATLFIFIWKWIISQNIINMSHIILFSPVRLPLVPLHHEVLPVLKVWKLSLASEAVPRGLCQTNEIASISTVCTAISP